MNELVVIVEGETEQVFVRDQLAVHLTLHKTTAWAVLPGKNRNRGGVKKWDAAKQDILRTLKERRFCSTMFDFYAMPTDWPGRKAASTKPWNQRASYVESKLQAEITKAMGHKFDAKVFIPYVQLHEFEALAFADVRILSTALTPLGNLPAETILDRFTEVLDEAGNPEAINDGYETCPSRRIATIVPAYKKRAQGPIIAGQIGINVLRERCSHFGEWISRLERLAAFGNRQ